MEDRNAISDAFIEEFDDVITQVEAKAKAGVIHGHGPHFCAGLDLAEHVKGQENDDALGRLLAVKGRPVAARFRSGPLVA